MTCRSNSPFAYFFSPSRAALKSAERGGDGEGRIGRRRAAGRGGLGESRREGGEGRDLSLAGDGGEEGGKERGGLRTP